MSNYEKLKESHLKAQKKYCFKWNEQDYIDTAEKIKEIIEGEE